MEITNVFSFIGNITDTIFFDLIIIPITPYGVYIGKTGCLILSKNEQYDTILQEFLKTHQVPLANGTTIEAKKSQFSGQQFKNVLFLVDDCSKNISDLVFQTLCKTRIEDVKIAMPIIRINKGKTTDTIEQQLDGIQKFQKTYLGKCMYIALCNEDLAIIRPFIERTRYLGEWNGQLFQT
jgi:hypothetical protein